MKEWQQLGLTYSYLVVLGLSWVIALVSTEDCAIFNVALFSKDFFSTLTKKEKRNRLPVSSVSY